MNLIDWNDNLSVKISHLDDQHKQLINMINELHNAMSKGQGKLVVNEILKRMTEYTVNHFKSEEMLFEKYDYPETLKHKDEHSAFVGKVADFNSKFEKGELFLSVEVMMFLKDWLINHIAKSDKSYSDYLNSKGVK